MFFVPYGFFQTYKFIANLQRALRICCSYHLGPQLQGFQSYSYTLDSAGAGGCSMSLSMVRTHGKRKKSYVQDVLKSISLCVCVCASVSVIVLFPSTQENLPAQKKYGPATQKKTPSTHMAIKKHDPSFQVGQLHWKHTCALGFPAARRSRYYQRSPTHGDPSSLPPRNWKKKSCSQLGQSPHLFVHVSNLWKFGRQVRSSFFIVLLASPSTTSTSPCFEVCWYAFFVSLSNGSSCGNLGPPVEKPHV